MSSKPEDADHFSHSPSLQDILTYVDYRDIERVRKVSQHLSEVINKYQMHLPRPQTRIYFVFSTQKHQGKDALHVEAHVDQGLRVCINDERVRQVYPMEYACWKEAENVDRPCIMLGGEFEKRKSTRVKYIPIKTLEDGLRRAFNFIFRTWHFYAINIIKSDSVSGKRFDGLIEIMGSVYKKTFCRCGELIVEKAWSGVDKVYEAIGSSQVTINKPVNLAQWIPSQNFDRIFEVIAAPESASLDPIIDLLKRWLAKELWIEELDIDCHSGYRYSLNEILAALDGFVLTDTNRIPHNNQFEAVFRRASDNTFLYFGYSKRTIKIKQQATAKLRRSLNM